MEGAIPEVTGVQIITWANPTPEKRPLVKVVHIEGGTTYNTFNKTLAQIAREIQDKGVLTEPNPRQFLVGKMDHRAYCAHHNGRGYGTESCRDSQEQVEDLVRNDYLNEYIDHEAMMVRQRMKQRPMFTIV